MNKYPAQQVTQQLASHGRHGDSMLVHMAPEEVAGIASLSPGSMTRNPVTGLPEAFNFKKLLQYGLPIAASIAMPALAPAMAPALASGLGAGVATTALTGDIKRGMMSGIMGGAMGAATGAAAGNAATAAAGSQATSASLGGIANNAVGSSVLGAVPSAATQAVSTPAFQMAGSQAASSLLPNTAAMTASAAPASSIGSRMAAPFASGSGLGGELFKARTMLPMSIAAGQMAGMDADDAMNKLGREQQEESDAKLRQSYGDLQGAYRGGNPALQAGEDPFRRNMSVNQPGMWKPPGMAMGGRTTTRIRDKDDKDGLPEGMPPKAYGGIDPVAVQRGLRGNVSVAPPPGFAPGFSPEFSYFQDDPSNIQSPPITGPADWSKRYEGGPSHTVLGQPLAQRPGSSAYFNSVLPPNKPGEEDAPKGMAGGGITAVNPGPPPAQPGRPGPEDVKMLAMALMGGAEGADQIINQFVERFGPKAFQALRQMILSQGNPGTQTEGMIQGQGGGMDDKVPGMIGNQQEVAVSPGEYIVPADVVSGLGDGSSDAGASELDGMMNNVRQARNGGRMSQPPAINAQRMMPRV
jgi:hypothetical protein